jgi:hypothetical protein
MGTGLWRDGHWPQVSDEGIESVPISRALHEKRGYHPLFSKLPTREDYDARKDPMLSAEQCLVKAAEMERRARAATDVAARKSNGGMSRRWQSSKRFGPRCTAHQFQITECSMSPSRE